ncbi:MAG: hypothetical protein MJ096_03900 [Clostridia bacterium]|nr:hypothetical protein [Clostridia bacterium]
MDQSENKTSGKHVKLRIVLFALAVIIAIGAFTYGIVQIGHKDEGYYTIETVTYEDAMTYGNDVTLEYYCEGGSNAIKETLNELKELWSVNLVRAYKLLDTENTYEGFVNLKTINDSLGKEIEVSEELLGILVDAWDRTNEEKGFNMFAGALNDKWQTLLMIDDPAEFDPMFNEDEAERISSLAAMTSDLSHFTFKVTDKSAGKIIVDADKEYKDFLKSCEYEGPILDLGLLHDAYVAKIARDSLNKTEYTNGYIVTKSGITVSLATHKSGEYCLYANGEAPHEAAALPVTTDSVCSLFRAFPLTDGALGFYSPDGNTLRHPYFITSTGGFADIIASAIVVTDDPVEAVYANIILNQFTDAASIEKFVNESDMMIAFTLQDGSDGVLCNDKAQGSIRILSK